MYSEWVSLQTCIQSDTTHTSVLKRFPATVGKEIVVPIVRNLAQGLSINGNDQPSKLHSSEEVNWTMEVICHGLTLPFSELEIIKECVNIYCEWLTGCLLKKKLCIPKPVMESPVTYSITVLSHLYNLFVPREKASQDLVNKQALLCHRALRTLENVTKESQCLTRELWEAILKFLLATTDTLLAPPKEKDGISDELAARMVSVLFEMWLLSCSTYFPVPSLWRTFRDMCANWRHHEPVILQWNRVNYALTAPLLLKLYGPDHPEIVIGASEKALVTALTKECVEKLSPDCLLQCWFRFLHILSNPVDLCKIGVISETPMFLHHAIANAKVVEPSQHECLQQLPVIFYKAMKGIANLMDSFLGISQPQRQEDSNTSIISITAKTSTASLPSSTAQTPPSSRSSGRPSAVVMSSGAKPMSPNKFSSHSLAPSQSSVTSQVSGGYLQYSARPSLSSDRSSINSILNLLGPWLFEAAMSFDNRRSRPGSQSQRTASMSSPSTDPLTNRELNFDIGRAEACGAIARLLCSKKSGEVIQPVYIARSYMALYHALSLTYPIKGDVLTFTLFHMADILRVDLPGVNGLIPKVLGAIEAVLTTDQHNFKIHEQLTEVELRKACIHLLMSLVCLPLHFHKMDIKDLYSGELMLTYLSLTSRVAKIILNALTVEKSSGNSNMLLGCLALLVQDMATHENREMEKFSSTTSNLSQDQYNFPGAGASETTSQSGDGHSELSSSSNEKSTIEVVLRRPSTKQNHDDFSSAAGLLVGAVKQICTGLITDWWTDYHLAVGALEVLTTLAKVKLQIISTAMCKDTVSHICRLISFLCCRPPQNQTRDLHSTILSALYCLSQWILEHSYLLQDKECLYTVLEVVELGISGKRSQQPNSSTVLMKGDKEHLPMSLRVKDAAEALLMCIIDHVDSFPAPCGPESLYSTLSERDLTEDPSNFKYFALNNNTLLAILEDNSKPVGGGTSAIKLVIRGPFGRQIWLIEPKSEPAGSLKPLHVPRPKSSDVPLEKPKITQRWWPSGVENIPLVKADNSLPKLDDLEDLDSVLAGVINEQIEKELKNGPSLAPGRPGPPDEAQPPKSSDYRQAARALLSQLGLLGAQSLQDFQGMPPSLSRLQTKDNEFFTALDSLDNTSNRARHSVYVFYVKAGQSKVSDILDNMTSYRSLNGDFKDILLSLGWPVNINHHPGWTGLITEESHPGHPRPHQPSVDQIPLACGPAAYDGTKWLLYWGDSRTEVAFIVPTEQRLAMIIRKKQHKVSERPVVLQRKLSEDNSRSKTKEFVRINHRRASLDVGTERVVFFIHQQRKIVSVEQTIHEDGFDEAAVDIIHNDNSNHAPGEFPKHNEENGLSFMDSTEKAEGDSTVNNMASGNGTIQVTELLSSLSTPKSGNLENHSKSEASTYGANISEATPLRRSGGFRHSPRRMLSDGPVSDTTVALPHFVPTSPNSAEKHRRITYDMAMGVISAEHHASIISNNELRKLKSPKRRKTRSKFDYYDPHSSDSSRANASLPSDEGQLAPAKKPKGFGKGLKKKLLNKVIDDRPPYHRRRSVSDTSKRLDVVKQTSTGSDCVFTASGSFRSSSDSARESGRNQKTAEVRMIVVWCERVEDKDIIPWESLLNTTNGPNDFRCPPEYMIVYITALQSGLFRVHIHSQTERCGTPLPLVDGAVCVKRTLGVMIRQTAINMAARRRLLNELSLIPHNKRAQKMQELIGKYRVNCTESEFYESLFRESYDQK